MGKKRKPIPIIDLFAGPGGLGEGFSSVFDSNGTQVFKIKLSIEKDAYAHSTLSLRAFYRQFPRRAIPSEYYDYLAGRIKRDQLFTMYPAEAENAQNEAWLAELGGKATANATVDVRIRKALGGERDWVLIGGPPCQAYSLVGRSRMRGADKEKYEEDLRHFLYKQYLRILATHLPPVFIMENVKGLLSAEVKEQKIFGLILADLQNPLRTSRGADGRGILSYKLFSLSKGRPTDLHGTQPEDYVVRSEEYGIPQARHRIIILGIRSDFYRRDPELLQKNGPAFIEEVIGDLPKLRSGLSKETDSGKNWHNAVKTIDNAKWLDALAPSIRDAILRASKRIASNATRGEMFMPATIAPEKYTDWFADGALGGVCNHETRAHIREDLYRYFFAAVFARENGYSPTLDDFPKGLLPLHRNVQEALDGSKFNDRFRVQVRGRPSTTVVSHISKDGHYYIHYDPSQCRSLTVREAARLQTFPDNYFFEGPRTEQYQQVGNAVPPMLAHKIAGIVAALFRNSV